MENRLNPVQDSKPFLWIVIATVVILTALTVMAGLPPANQMAKFVFGIVVLIGECIVVALASWHLLFRPLPANLKTIQQSLISVQERHIVALVTTLGVLSVAIAAIWDEIWHSTYGIPFGQDFFWRPHLLMYFGFSTAIFVSIWSWWIMMRRGKGTLQQRFRANPILGISFLAGIFTLFALIGDPLWHSLYGQDLTAWSLPHMVLLVMVITNGLVAIAYHKSLLPQREWKATLNFAGRDLLIAVVLAGVLLDYLLVLTVDWYLATADRLSVVTARPDWILPLFIAFNITLFGVIALQTSRRVGIATLVGLVGIAIRLIFNTVLGASQAGLAPTLTGLPVLIALDVWYGIAIHRTGKPPAFWSTAGIAAIVFSIAGLPLMDALYPYPPVNAATLPGLLIAGVVGCLGGAWLGQMLGLFGSYAGAASKAENKAEKSAQSTTQNAKLSLLVYAAFVLFLVFFLVTAVPPVG